MTGASSETVGQYDARNEALTAAIFSSAIALLLAAFYAAARIGFPLSTPALVRALGISLLIVNRPVRWRSAVTEQSRQSWWDGPALDTAILCGILGLAGTLTPEPATVVGDVAAIIGAASFIYNLWRWSRQTPAFPGIRFTGFVLLVAIWTAGTNWGSGLRSPLFLETLSLHGADRLRDTFFHASVANMINVYGTVTLGLDRLLPFSYHSGSHWLFSGMSNLIGIRSLEFYDMAYPIIIAPLWFFALRLFVVSCRTKTNMTARGALAADPATWIVLLAVVFGALPAPIRFLGGFGPGIFFSESYATALIGGFLFAAVYVAFLRDFQDDDSSLDWTDWLFLVVVVPAGIAALGFLKISFMGFGLVAHLYVLIRLGIIKRPIGWISLLASVGVFLAVKPLVMFTGPPRSTRLFSQLNDTTPRDLWLYFFVLHLFWTIAYSAYRMREEGVEDRKSLRAALAMRKMPDVEILVLIAIIGLIPGLVLPIGIDGIYFSDVQRWFAAGLVLANPGMLQWIADRWHSLVHGSRNRWARRIAAVAIAAPLAGSMAVTFGSWTADMMHFNLDTRRDLLEAAGRPRASMSAMIKGREILSRTLLAEGIAKSPSGQVVFALDSLSKLPKQERRQTLLFIPQSTTRYWNILQSPTLCSEAATTGPAISGIAMLNGAPPVTCHVSTNYQMGGYPIRSRLQTESDTEPAKLCSAARPAGMRYVIRLLQAADSSISTDRIDCARVL